MSVLTAIWAALGWKGAATVGGLLAGLGAFWAFLRRRRPAWDTTRIPPAPPGANSPEHGKIDAAREAAAATMESGVRGEADRVKRKLTGGGACLLALALAGASACAHRPLPVPNEIGPIPRAYLTLEQACEAKDGQVVCSQEGVLRAIDESAEAVIAAERCKLGLGAERAHRAVDQAACVEVAAELESARSQRWIWGAVGTAVGAIVTGLLVGLIQ